MDSPDPHKDTSSVAVRPDITPNSDGVASPLLVPSQKSKTQGGRRRVHQKAKRSFIEENDNITSDEEQDHVGDHKPLITRPRREVSYRPMDSVKLPKSFNAEPSNPIPEPNTQPREEAMVDLNGGYSRPSSVSNPGSEVNDRSNDRATSMTPFNIGDSRPASVAAPELDLDDRSDITSLDPNEQKKKMSSTVRGSLELNGIDQGLNSLGKRVPEPSTKVKLPALKLEVDEPDDDGQDVNAFSLSSLPQSTGNSPVAIKTERKTGTKKRTTKAPSKQPRKQAARQVAQHQGKSTMGQSKKRRPAPLERELEPSPNVEHGQEDATIGPDLKEDQGSVRPSIPRQAKFKPLKSPVNTYLAATQDLISASSNVSDEIEEDDNVEDDDFMPTSSLNPVKDESAQPKTRARTQHGAIKNADTVPKTSKPKSINSQPRAGEKKPSDNGYVTKSKPKAPSKMASKDTTVEKTRVSETKFRPIVQPEESAPATCTPTQAKEESIVRQSADFNTSTSDGQSEQNRVGPNQIPTKSRQTETGGLDKPGNARQVNEAVGHYSQNATVVVFGRVGPKSTRKPEKTAKAPVSPDQHALPSAEDDASAATKPESATASHEKWKQRATITDSTRFSTPLSAFDVSKTNTQRRPAQHQSAGDVHSLMPVTEADEDGGPKPAYTDQTRADEKLMNAECDDTMSDGQVAAVSNEGLFDYTDDGNTMGVREPASQPVSGVVLPENRNCKKLSAHEHNIAAVPHEEGSSLRGIPAQAARHDHSAAGQNHLKRRLPENNAPHGMTNVSDRAYGFERCLQPDSSSTNQRLPSTMLPPMGIGKVAKKPRLESVQSASISQDEDVVSVPADSRIQASESSDDVFLSNKQGEPVKRTAFVRNCISNDPKDHGATKFDVFPPNRDQNVEYSSPTNHRQRARALQPPDSVARRVLAAISAPEADSSMPLASSHDHGMNLVQDGERIPDLDDQGRAWKKATEPYGGGIAEIMHKSVNVILRNLKTKEDAVNDVVEDYERQGKRIIDKFSADNDTERKQLIQQYEQHRLNYIKVCTEARRRATATSNDLKSVDLGKILARAGRDPAVDRLKELQRALQKRAW